MIATAIGALFAGYMLVFAAVHKGGIFATNPWAALTIDYAGPSAGVIATQKLEGDEPSTSGFDAWRDLYELLNPVSPITVAPKIVDAIKSIWPW